MDKGLHGQRVCMDKGLNLRVEDSVLQGQMRVERAVTQGSHAAVMRNVSLRCQAPCLYLTRLFAFPPLGRLDMTGLDVECTAGSHCMDLYVAISSPYRATMLLSNSSILCSGVAGGCLRWYAYRGGELYLTKAQGRDYSIVPKM